MSQAPEAVILLHGLGRTARSMSSMARALEARGYQVWNKSYPSRKQDIDTLAQHAIAPGVAHCVAMGCTSIHFVTHSMGAILLRQYLQHSPLPSPGHIVMLAPPNQGSELTDRLKGQFWYPRILGPAAMQLGTDAAAKPNALQPVTGTIGVIAGTGLAPPWLNWWFTGENDGKVSVQSTRLQEMSDFLTVRRGHTTIANSPGVIQQVVHFLQHGRFARQRYSQPG